MEEKDIKKEAEEEQPPTRLTEHSLASPDVAWERHSSESHGPPDVSETQYETQLTDSQDEASIKGDDAREGDPDQTVDIEQFHHVEDGQQKGDRIQSLHTDAQGEMQESGSCPDDGSLNSIEEIGTEELTTRALTEGDGERMDKTSIKGKTTEGERDTMSHGDEDDLKKDCDILLCLRQEEGQEEKRLQRNAAMEFLASEGEGEPIVSEQIRNQLFVNKESAEAKLHQNNGNLPEAQVETCKADNAANLTDMQNSANQREKSGVMNNDSPVELTAIHCSVNDRLILDVRAEQEKHSCKLEVKDCYRQTSQKSTLVTVNSINNVQGIYKDQEVVSQGLNPPTFEEVQRGFPECNNEQRQDENPTHSVLEERDSEECQTVFLPEEMGDKQNVQNNCSSAGSDNLLLTECMVEQQKTKGNIQEVIFSDETVKLFEDKKREMAETSCRGFILLEDLSESGLVRQEVGMEPTCSEDTGDMQDVGLHLEEFGFKGDNIVSKEKSKSKTEKEILNVSVASLSVSNTESGNNLVGESEAQLKAMSNDTVSKSTTKYMNVVLAEETEKHATMIHTEESSLHSAQEVIDEETIDPWIQRALSQDADGVKWQEKPEPGQQMGQKVEPLNSEGDEVSRDLTEGEDQFVNVSQSGRSDFRSDTGMSSGTEQATFWDDAHCNSGSLKGESQLWTLNVTGSLLSTTSDMLESDGSEIFMSGPQGNFTKESGSQSDVERTDQTGQTEKQSLEEDIQSSTKMDTFVQVTKMNEDTLKDTAVNSVDAGSGPYGSSSEVSLEEENVSSECTSQGGTESSRLLKLSLMGTPQGGLSEDCVDALPRLNRTQVTTHPPNQMEVLLHNLFISEKSS